MSTPLSYEVDGRVAIITGAGRGIGAAVHERGTLLGVAVELGDRGADLPDAGALLAGGRIEDGTAAP